MAISNAEGEAPNRGARIQTLLSECRGKASNYTEREVAFLRDVGAGRYQLSQAQFEWLEGLAAREPVDFAEVNRRAMPVLEALCRRWAPAGRMQANEWVALNPTRADGSAGSFRINVKTGKWADFADNAARGGDPISLAAYLFHRGDQFAAARDLKRMLGA